MTRPPLLSLLGSAVAAAGLALDVAVHLALPADGHEHLHAAFSPSEHTAHLVVMLGMVLILAGVVADGARRQRARRQPSASIERSPGHAHR
jgi:hypothetical protein